MAYLVDDDLYPYSAVCAIQVRFGNEWYVGTGVLVGRNDVLTASHVVYRPGYGLADEVMVAPSFEANAWKTTGVYNDPTYIPVYYEYYTGFDPDGDGYIEPGNAGPGLEGSELDIALLSLEEPAGDTFGWMGIDFEFQSGTVNVTGHPNSLDNASSNAAGYTWVDSVDWVLPIHQFDVSEGNSGGPVWYDGYDSPYVVGIVSTYGFAVDVGGHDWLLQAISDNDHYIEEQQVPSIAADISQEDAQHLALLYEAAFDRRADLGGLNFWIDQFEMGMPLTLIADNFIGSVEFQETFGEPANLSNEAFVDVLYENVLSRDGEAAGVDYWTRELDSDVGRDFVLLAFAVSPENRSSSTYVEGLSEGSTGNWVFG